MEEVTAMDEHLPNGPPNSQLSLSKSDATVKLKKEWARSVTLGLPTVGRTDNYALTSSSGVRAR